MLASDVTRLTEMPHLICRVVEICLSAIVIDRKMSRATDAFSSLISDVPGVDTSCFVKRTLNDLKPKDESVKRPEPCETPPAVPQEPVQQPQSHIPFASCDLDTLGKPNTPPASTQCAAQFEDLFENIPGCAEAVLEATEHQTTVEDEPVTKPEPESDSSEEDVENVGPIETERSPSVASATRIENEAPLPVEPRFEEEVPSAPPAAPVMDESATKPTDLKQKFEKYKTTLNKKAGSLKKKGLRAVKQGLGAAQEWMDRYVEDRKQNQLTTSQKKEDVRQIERFLAELEQLSHYRREQLMSEISPDFFQKVMDYAAAKGLAIEHLFITSQPEEEAQLTEPDPHTEDHLAGQQSNKNASDREEEYLEVTGTDSQGGYVETTGEESVEEVVQETEEKEFDLLGLSNNKPETVAPQPDPEETLASPDDLDAFFTGGAAQQDPEVSSATASVTVPVMFPHSDDLMEFEGGSASQGKSDFSAMYRQLKEGGQHSEEEIRAILKSMRHEEKQNKMAAALQAKMEREREVEETQELHHALKEKHLQKIVAWREQHAQNMRGLLTTLQSVLWEDSGWKPLTVADVLEVSQVKKAYMKANLIIHPDKVKQKGGTAEQVVVADMVFNVLKEGWQKFQSQ